MLKKIKFIFFLVVFIIFYSLNITSSYNLTQKDNLLVDSFVKKIHSICEVKWDVFKNKIFLALNKLQSKKEISDRFKVIIWTIIVGLSKYDVIDWFWENVFYKFKNEWKLFKIEEFYDHFSWDISNFYDYDSCYESPESYWWSDVCDEIKDKVDYFKKLKYAEYKTYSMVFVNKSDLSWWLNTLKKIFQNSNFFSFKSDFLQPEVFMNWAWYSWYIVLDYDNCSNWAPDSKCIITFEWQDWFAPELNLFFETDKYLWAIYYYWIEYSDKVKSVFDPVFEDILYKEWNGNIEKVDYVWDWKDVFENNKYIKSKITNLYKEINDVFFIESYTVIK